MYQGKKSSSFLKKCGKVSGNMNTQKSKHEFLVDIFWQNSAWSKKIWLKICFLILLLKKDCSAIQANTQNIEIIEF